jgi:threonine dehydrogenase-like Zn-dependent dehydrogenase
MKAVIWNGESWPKGVTYGDFPIPEPQPGWVLVKTAANGICGSDLHYLQGYTRHLVSDKNLPAVMGHEAAGVVEKLGEGVADLKVGDRVALEPLHACRELGLLPCPMCQTGNYQLCPNLSIVGVPIGRMIPGGYGEYCLYHHTRVFKLPDNVSFEEAALLDTLACTVHAINLARPVPGETAAVVGCGIIGIDTIQCLKAAGLKDILAISKYDWQGEMARRYGATEVIVTGGKTDAMREVKRLTQGWGVDQVYECVGGNTEVFQKIPGMVRPKGKIIMEGVFSGSSPVDLLTLLLRESPVLPSMCYSYYEGKREFQMALDMVSGGKAEQASMITHRFAIDEWCEAIQTAIDKNRKHTSKAMFIYE